MWPRINKHYKQAKVGRTDGLCTHARTDACTNTDQKGGGFIVLIASGHDKNVICSVIFKVVFIKTVPKHRP